MYDDDRVGGERGRESEAANELAALAALRGRGKGLPSWKLAGPLRWYLALRSGVWAGLRELGGGDAPGEALRFRVEPGPRDAISLGPWLI